TRTRRRVRAAPDPAGRAPEVRTEARPPLRIPRTVRIPETAGATTTEETSSEARAADPARRPDWVFHVKHGPPYPSGTAALGVSPASYGRMCGMPSGESTQASVHEPEPVRPTEEDRIAAA